MGPISCFKSQSYFCRVNLLINGVWLLLENVHSVKIFIENLSVHVNSVTEFEERQVANASRDWPVLNKAGVR